MPRSWTLPLSPHADGRVLLDALVKTGPANSCQRIDYPRDLRSSCCQGLSAGKKVYPILLDVIAYRRVVVYNADYDQGVIRGCCRAAGLTLSLSRWDCAMLAYAAFAGEQSSRSRGGYRWFKLDEAAAAFGIEPGEGTAVIGCRGVQAGRTGDGQVKY